MLEELELTVLYEQFAKQEQPLKKLRYSLTWFKWTRYLRQLLLPYDDCLTASEQDRRRVLAVFRPTCPLGAIPDGADLAFCLDELAKAECDTPIYSVALPSGARFDAVSSFLRDNRQLVQAERLQIKLIITRRLDGVPPERLPTTGQS